MQVPMWPAIPLSLATEALILSLSIKKYIYRVLLREAECLVCYKSLANASRRNDINGDLTDPTEIQ